MCGGCGVPRNTPHYIPPQIHLPWSRGLPCGPAGNWQQVAAGTLIKSSFKPIIARQVVLLTCCSSRLGTSFHTCPAPGPPDCSMTVFP